MPRVTMLDAANLRKLKEEITKEEREVLKVYRNSQGFMMVGIGHKIVRGDLEFEKPQGYQITKHRSNALYERDITLTLVELDKKLPWLKLEPPEIIRPVAAIAFQLGVPAVVRMTRMLRAIIDKNYELAYTEGLKSMWARQTPARARRVMTMIRNVKDKV